MHHCQSEIIANYQIAPLHYIMRLVAPQISSTAKAGQFIHMRIKDDWDPLLRRPFTVYKSEADELEVLYQVIGRGTAILSEMPKGAKLDLIGPLGRGFWVKADLADLADLETPIIVGGGVGTASLLMLAQQLTSTHKNKNLITLIGALTEERLLGVEDFRMTGCELLVSTDDGSLGHKGFVTQLLEALIAQRDLRSAQIFACGPYGMLKAVGKLALSKGLPAQVAFESQMGCGLGVCLGCCWPVKDEDGGVRYDRVCTEGPVFDAKEIVWL